MNRILIIVSLILTTIAIALTSLCAAQEHSSYTILDTEIRSIYSKANGKKYQLFVSLPKHYSNSTKHYPLVLINDATYSFPIAASIFRRMAPHEIQEAIVIGISYSENDLPQVSRTRDYTPTHSPNEKLGHSKLAKNHSGGADKYTIFIADELLPFIKKKYKIEQSKTIFVGHSFRGLLGTYILLKQPKLFSHYIIGSPSLWYDNKIMFLMEKNYSKNHDELPVSLYMATGELEDNNAAKMVSQMKNFERQLTLRHYKNFTMKTEILPNESHLSSFPSMLSNGLRWAIPIY